MAPSIPGVRRLHPVDIPELIALVQVALPDTMAARLGQRFAVQYFRGLLTEPAVHVDGYFREGALVGFIVYTADVAAALRAVYIKHAVRLTWALLPALGSPARMAFVARITWAILAGGREAGSAVPAELLSIGLLPEVRGRGAVPARGATPVATALVTRACAVLEAGGVGTVKVFCKDEALDPAANRFVQKLGFVASGRVRRFGLDSILYLRRLDRGAAGHDPSPDAGGTGA